MYVNTKKSLGAELIPTKTETWATNDKRDEKPSMLMLQYRVNRSQLFGNKVRSITKEQIVSTARKLTITLPILNSSFSRDLKSNVVYKLSCCGCNSSYARQTVQHLATKVEEHKKEDSSVGIHKRQ